SWGIGAPMCERVRHEHDVHEEEGHASKASLSICAIQLTWPRIGLTLEHVKPAGGPACWDVAKGCIRLRVMGKGIGTTRRIGYQETWELPACHQHLPSRWPRQPRSRWGSARHLTRRPLRSLAFVRRPASPDW